jgi:electron transfer flavoprotein beta subunit
LELIVCFKQVIEETELRVDREGGRLILDGVPTKISDDDRNAIEEAVKIKQKLGGNIIGLTLGSAEAKKQTREALAMGCDKAYLVIDKENSGQDSFRTAMILADAIKKIGKFDLILCGSASTDSLAGQVGPSLAELLGLPQLSYTKKIEVMDGRVRVEKSLDDAVEVMESSLPALVTVTREINEPRVPTLMQVMVAGKKLLVEWKLEDLPAGGDGYQASMQVVKMEIPKMNRKRLLFKDKPAEAAQKLVESVRKEGVI